MFFCKHKFLMILLLVGVFLGVSNPATVEAYLWGDLSGTTINFNNILDTSTTELDPDPALFGGTMGPMVVGDQLLFFPDAFSSSSSNGVADTTSGTLQITLVAQPGFFIEDLRIEEFGDYTLTGSGTGATQAQISGLLTVTPVGPGTIQTDFFSALYELPSASSGPFTGAWEIELDVPVTMAVLSFNNNLQTSSESGTTSFIQKKVISGPVIGITVNPDPVPIPGAIWLLASGFIGFVGFRRKFDW